MTSWLIGSDGQSWPTVDTNVPGASCRMGLPAGWQRDDPPAVVDGEASAGYRGPTAVDWLTVRYRETDRDGELKQWVDGTLRAIGFPVIPPGRVLIDLPNLDDWNGGESDDSDRLRFHVDELRPYSGSATWMGDPDGARRLRLYVLLARRGRQSWLIALGLETATVSGMSPQMIARNDHSRAAAVLSRLVLEPPSNPS